MEGLEDSGETELRDLDRRFREHQREEELDGTRAETSFTEDDLLLNRPNTLDLPPD